MNKLGDLEIPITDYDNSPYLYLYPSLGFEEWNEYMWIAFENGQIVDGTINSTDHWWIL